MPEPSIDRLNAAINAKIGKLGRYGGDSELVDAQAMYYLAAARALILQPEQAEFPPYRQVQNDLR